MLVEFEDLPEIGECFKITDCSLVFNPGINREQYKLISEKINVPSPSYIHINPESSFIVSNCYEVYHE